MMDITRVMMSEPARGVGASVDGLDCWLIDIVYVRPYQLKAHCPSNGKK